MAYSTTLFTVMTPSVTRSTPSILAIGGTSDFSKFKVACSGFPKYFAAIDEKGNVMKGTWWGGSKLDDKLNGATVFRMPYEEAVKVCNFVAKYAPHVEISLMKDQYS